MVPAMIDPLRCAAFCRAGEQLGGEQHNEELSDLAATLGQVLQADGAAASAGVEQGLQALLFVAWMQTVDKEWLE